MLNQGLGAKPDLVIADGAVTVDQPVVVDGHRSDAVSDDFTPQLHPLRGGGPGSGWAWISLCAVVKVATAA